MTTPHIARPEKADIRTVWPGEAADFTPWLADNLDWLDFLSLGPLSLVSMEQQLPDTWRSLDILAATDDGHRVAIENQYGIADHDHLTRGLAYAVGLNARALVVIAEGHRPEFVAIADYLNTAYEQMDEDTSIAVYLVQVIVERVGDTFIPRFTVLSAPNQWRTRASSSRRQTVGSVEEFLASCADDLRAGFDETIKWWVEQSGCTLRRGGKTVSLWYQIDGPPKRVRSFFTLEPSGVVWINRDFARELTGRSDEELDAIVAETAPSFFVVGAGDWWKATNPDPGTFQTVARAILERPNGG